MISNDAEGCRKADYVIATSATAHRQLQAAGIDAQRIVRIPDAAWFVPVRSPETRVRAATALHQVNQTWRFGVMCD